MKKILKFGSYVLVAALATALTLTMVTVQQRQEPRKLMQMEKLIQERFIGEADQQLMEDVAAEAMVAALGDRWSHYIPASSYASYQERSENAFVGVGITISQAEQGFQIMEVEENGPAKEAGVQVGDLLVQVDGQDVARMDANQVKELVRGEEGSTVTLGLLRQEEALSLPVERRRIQVQVATGIMLEDQVGLVTIENFDDRCAQETIAAVDALMEQGAKALIFDVRNNPGGYAHEMVKTLDYLLPEGELFRMEHYDGRQTVDKSGPECVDLPMAVLVNGDSYSAAEFFAAALKEYEAALVVGEQTCGKGYFQNTFRFQDGSALALSVGKYYTPKGVSLAGVGFTPDVPVAVDEATAAAIYYNVLEPGEDPQIQAAWKALTETQKEAA